MAERVPAAVPAPARGSLLDRHPALVYTVARLGLFLVALPPLYLAGMRGLLLLAFGLLVSGLLSLVLLHPIRARMGGRVSGFFARMNDRIDEATRAEDDEARPSAGDRQSDAEPRPGQQ